MSTTISGTWPIPEVNVKTSTCELLPLDSAFDFKFIIELRR